MAAVETFDVVPGKLVVSVFAHEISSVRCWTYVTSGLWPLGQRDIRLSVKQEPGETDTGFPRDILEYFRFLHAAALEKRIVEVGAATILSEQGSPLLPGSALRGVLYARAQAFDGVPDGGPSLAAILVTREEAEAAGEYGHARILGRLGEATRC